MAEKLLIQD